MDAPDAPSRLARRLGAGDAVVIGLGSMIGAGVFSAVGPAAGAAGSGLLIELAVAGPSTASHERATADAWVIAVDHRPGWPARGQSVDTSRPVADSVM